MMSFKKRKRTPTTETPHSKYIKQPTVKNRSERVVSRPDQPSTSIGTVQHWRLESPRKRRRSDQFPWVRKAKKGRRDQEFDQEYFSCVHNEGETDTWLLSIISNNPPKTILESVLAEQRRFHNLLRSPRDCFVLRNVALMLEILEKLTSLFSSALITVHGLRAKEALEDLFPSASSEYNEAWPFWSALATLIRTTPTLEETELHISPIAILNAAVNFLNFVLEILDYSFIYLPVDELCGALSQLASQASRYRELKDKSQQLLATRDKAREKHRKNTCSPNFCLVNILPTADELKYNRISPLVKCNKVEGDYDSIAEYLQLHYHLYREDFINPLRCALTDIHNQDEGSLEVKVYHDVQIVAYDTSREGIVHKISFKVAKGRKLRWEHNKQLLYGSLLCLSHDHFRTFVFATVAERNVAELHKGIATIRFVNESDSAAVLPLKQMEMIQSPAYFEAYASVIMRLQNLVRDPSDLPFPNYLVKCQPIVCIPSYLHVHQEIGGFYNFKGVLCSCKEECTHGHSCVDVTSESFWRQAEDTCQGLDKSQLQALQVGLTRELALIQGPPGTGKTYIGIKIVEALLMNRSAWSAMKTIYENPIMVMCYTNHALDQFLEGILNSTVLSNLVVRRLGGKSKNSKIEELNVKKHLVWPKRRRKKYSPELATRLQCEIAALECLCNGTSPNTLYETLCCSYLHPQKLMDCREFYPVWKHLKLQNSTQFDEMLAVIFQWLNIKYLPIEFHKRKNEENIFYDAESEENRRATVLQDNENWTGSGSEVMEYTTRRELQQFIHRVQQVKSEYIDADSLTINRYKLFKHCLKTHLEQLKTDYKRCLADKSKDESQYTSVVANALKTANVIGLTTTGASKYSTIISKVKSRIVIVEEAAEVLETHVIASLSKHTEHLILIGDHKQLRPKPTDYTLAKKFKLEISLFERLIKNNFTCVTLTHQHRMRPEIASLIHPEIYPELYDAKSVLDYDDIKGMQFNMFFLDHKWMESSDDDLKSHRNEKEAQFIIKFCQYLLLQGYNTSQITILTPYTGQVLCLKDLLRCNRNPVHVSGVRITPIDHYQGEENDIIILSLVRSRSIGFLNDNNRICVAMSRAKQGFYCIGNLEFLSKNSQLWKEIITKVKTKNCYGPVLSLMCKQHNKITMVGSPGDFNAIPDGGCSNDCMFRLSCGHICSRKCHPDDPDHINQRCTKPCAKTCPDGHRCKAPCAEKCPPCNESVQKVLPCGHQNSILCHENPLNVDCKEPCSKILPCGHKCSKKCGDKCTKKCTELVIKVWPCGHKVQAECSLTPLEFLKSHRCKAPCRAELACGHLCKGTCGGCLQGRVHIPCKDNCNCILICGHQCTSTYCFLKCPPCSKQCISACSHGPCGNKCRDPCISCAEPCKWKCPHQKCTKLCGEICDRPRCNEHCQKKLKCGHSCMGLCGELCPQVCRDCDPKNEVFVCFFGREDESDAVFIKLIDCEHVFEVSGLDHYMDMQEDDGNPIQWKKCPRCSSFIKQSLRYGNIIKQIKKDMNEVKKRENSFLKKSERMTLMRKSREICSEYGSQLHLKVDVFTDNYNMSDLALQSKHVILTAFCASEGVIKKAEKLKSFISSRWAESIISRNRGALLTEIQDHITLLNYNAEQLQGYLKSNNCRQLVHLTPQVQSDILAEHWRLMLLMRAYQLQFDINESNVLLSESEKEDLHQILKRFQFEPNSQTLPKIKIEIEYVALTKVMDEIRIRHPRLNAPSAEEVSMIVKAIGAKAGSWYKCPNGHYYNIGECGGATVEARCIECNSMVGGRNHQLRSDNSHAAIDGSRYAAWSEQANLQNYDL